MIRHVVWDWNGTLLDDVDHSLAALNALLSERGMPLLDRDGYRARFGFPVREFYVDLGFDVEREDFALLSERFIGHYKGAARAARPHAGARDTMSALRTRGVAQSVLSAMEATLLSSMLREHDLAEFLSHVRGLDDLMATSKVDLGVSLMRTLAEADVRPEQTLFVGDTLHDLETANAMGCECVLFVHGHQAPERLSQAGARLIHSHGEVLGFVRGHG